MRAHSRFHLHSSKGEFGHNNHDPPLPFRLQTQMTFSLQDNDKFALVAIENVYSALPADVEYQLADGTWVLGRVPFGFEDPWREWVGTTRFDQLRAANVILLQ